MRAEDLPNEPKNLKPVTIPLTALQKKRKSSENPPLSWQNKKYSWYWFFNYFRTAICSNRHLTSKPMEQDPNPVYKDERYGQYREMLYYYNQDGTFEKKVGKHGESDRVVLQQAWDFFNERTEEARRKVLAGKASPVVYYMEKILTDPMNLSMMAGISLWKVKLHCKPGFFKRLSEKTLKKYAEAFSITVDQLKHVE
jgi:hypothetical protein